MATTPSTPVPTVASAVPTNPSLKKYAGPVFVSIAVLVGVLIIVMIVRGHWRAQAQITARQNETRTAAFLPQVALPLASKPMSEWAKLPIPAGKDARSERIPIPSGMRPVLFGSDFRTHCVYKDPGVKEEREVEFGEGETPCPKGDMPFVYATNLRSRDANVVVYAFAPVE